MAAGQEEQFRVGTVEEELAAVGQTAVESLPEDPGDAGPDGQHRHATLGCDPEHVDEDLAHLRSVLLPALRDPCRDLRVGPQRNAPQLGDAFWPGTGQEREEFLRVPVVDVIEVLGRQPDELNELHGTAGGPDAAQIRVLDETECRLGGLLLQGNRAVGIDVMVGREAISGAEDIARQVLEQAHRPGGRLLGLQDLVVGEPEGQFETVSGHPVPGVSLFPVEVGQSVGDVVPVWAGLCRTVDGDAVQWVV